jgi:hypothetical protein
MYKDIVAKLINDAADPHITKYRSGSIRAMLSLPAMGDPYYSIDCVLTEAEAEELMKAFPNLEIIYA